MPGTTGPNLGLVWGWSPHDDGWGVGAFNPGFALLDSLVHLSVLDQLDTPPGSPSNGQRYIVGTSPTGAWAGQAKSIAVYLTTGTPGWTFFTPKVGWRAWNVATSAYWRFDGSVWLREVIAYGIAFSAPQTTAYAVDQVIGHHPLSVNITIPANFGAAGSRASQAGGSANATASTQFAVQRCLAAADPTVGSNWAALGTITFAAGTVTPTWATTGGTAQNPLAGDRLRVKAPAVPDATFAGFFCNIAGFET